MRRARGHAVAGVTCDDCARTFVAPDVWQCRASFGASALHKDLDRAA